MKIPFPVLGYKGLGRYVGEWYDKDGTPDGLPTKEMKDNASLTLYATAGVYALFTALSLVCIGVGMTQK